MKWCRRFGNKVMVLVLIGREMLQACIWSLVMLTQLVTLSTIPLLLNAAVQRAPLHQPTTTD